MILLYVDDDPEDITVLEEALTFIDPGSCCVPARSGREALDVLSADLVPDFIFLDINMPMMTGRDVLLAIRKENRFDNIPIIMCSTTINPREIQSYKDAGANDFLIKPTRFDDLCRSLNNVLRYGAIDPEKANPS